jgi:hypothetical protein
MSMFEISAAYVERGKKTDACIEDIKASGAKFAKFSVAN